MAYSLSSNQHIVKQFQNIRSIRLGEYRIRCPADMNNAEAHIEHTPVNSSVLEEKNGIRSYRKDLVDHHAASSSRRSCVFVSIQLSFRNNNKPKEGLIANVLYRR